MYAFYSLLVYILYTLFKRKGPIEDETGSQLEEGASAQVRDSGPGSVSIETMSRRGRDGPHLSVREGVCTGLTDSDSSSSDSEGLCLSEEDDDGDEHLLGDATSPLAEFLSFKQEAVGGRHKEALHGKAMDSPLLSVMSHLLTFLERYSHMQRLQQRAQEYRSQLRVLETQRRKRIKELRAAYRQKLRDKMSVIGNLEGVISEQQSLLEKIQTGGGSLYPQYPVPVLSPLSPHAQGGIHQLVESISSLQRERNTLLDELASLRQEVEQRGSEKQKLASDFQQQIQDLKQSIEEREDELIRLRTETGVTDSEKRILHLTAENESLKQSLSVTQRLLQQLSSIPSQSNTALIKENESLRTRVLQLETSLHLRAEQLSQLERENEQTEWRKREELRRLDDRIQGLQLELEKEKGKEPEIQYISKTVEVESPGTLRSLVKAEERNKQFAEQLSDQSKRCSHLEEQLRGSEEIAAGLRHKIVEYESEIGKLREDLLKEITHLEATKDEAVKEAAECSEQHLDQLREQFTGVQSHLVALQPALRSMKSNYNSLRSQVCNFSQFYEVAVTEAKRQICSVVSEVSEANRDLLEKYRKEVALRRKYHEQLMELKGNIRVLCRVKPVTAEDQQEGSHATVVTTDLDNDSVVTMLHKGRDRTFELDKVFQPQATQEEVFQEIESLVTSCIDGYNVCIFAYGQTGSGKTYTMEGSVENPGINQRALKALFSEIEDRKGIWSYLITVSLVEIYNEVLRDLLSKDPSEKLEIKINPDGSGQLHVPGLRVIEVKSFQHIKKILALGQRNRITHGTKMNQHSSRSHALLTITVTGTDLTSEARTTGKLNLVDLAGSERVWKSGAEGDRLKEAQNINRSLLALGDVIQALRAKQTHVPFRNSRLTYLLQDSLGKGNKTVMVVQISSLESNVGETMCSLKFAQRVCKVELGPASRKIESPGSSDFFS
ncbi:kinesin-like protein KIFC3 isoform X2 [Acipenser ruthenus]|uniref:kinesin-like protein KIFC3 isoform X2 n=1 Tax=Acipenser ruthenus TaxID=7906 RepID=UPI00145A4F6A|nr:kinesin-like protein KIFC3 isoform X2 [Acipenser ruthenus]